MVGLSGRVIGVDMTPAMVLKALTSAAATGMQDSDFRDYFGEAHPAEDGCALAPAPARGSPAKRTSIGSVQ